MFARSCIVGIAFLMFGLTGSILYAQKFSSTRDGVYSPDQAQQGAAIYAKQCATCHGGMLQGSGQNPPLEGDDFLNNWTDQTLADLDSTIRNSMPATNPGSLKPAEVADLIAYILKMNKFPAGKTELPVKQDSLKLIHIEKPQ